MDWDSSWNVKIYMAHFFEISWWDLDTSGLIVKISDHDFLASSKLLINTVLTFIIYSGSEFTPFEVKFWF